MTKLKSKKLTKSTFAIIIMAIVMVAMIAFGGTYAYFTASSTQDETKISTGYLKIRDNNAINQVGLSLDNVFPTQELIAAGHIADPSVSGDTNKGILVDVQTNDKAGNYVAVKIQFDVYDYRGQKITMPSHEGETWDKKISSDNAAWGIPTGTNGASWDQDGDGVWDETSDAEGVKKPEMADYKYKKYTDGVTKDGEGKLVTTSAISEDVVLTTAPDLALDELEYLATKASYDSVMEDYREDLKAYNVKAAKARLINSLNTDTMIENENAFNVTGVTGVTDFSYSWRRMKTGGAVVKGVYACVTDATGETFQAIGKATDGAYTGTENSGTITLIVNEKAFALPAALADNWDEGYTDKTGDGNSSDDTYKQHSEAGLMNGTIVISFQAVSIQATGLTEYNIIADTLIDLLNSKWNEPNGPGITPELGDDTAW